MTARQYDENGYFEIKANPISRVGVFPYSGAQLGLTGDDASRVYRVYRPAEELGHPDCINSFRLMPVVDEHTMLGPTAMAQSPAAMAAETKGVHGVLGDEVFYKDGWLLGNLKIFSSFLQDKIAAGVRELSAGYRCIYEMTGGTFEGQPYDAIQRKIRGNHLALVPEGRMGPAVAVMDHFKFAFDLKDATMADEKDPKGAAPEMTLEACAAMLGQIGPQVAKINEQLAALNAAPKTPDTVVDKEEGATVPAAATTDTEKAIAAMDAAVKSVATAVTQIATDVAALKAGGNKSAIGEIAQRDALAKRLAPHIGVFDHADKTLADVAKYGVDKLKLTAPAGYEQVALDAYLAATGPAAVVRQVAAMDAAPAGNVVDTFLKTANDE